MEKLDLIARFQKDIFGFGEDGEKTVIFSSAISDNELLHHLDDSGYVVDFVGGVVKTKTNLSFGFDRAKNILSYLKNRTTEHYKKDNGLGRRLQLLFNLEKALQ